MRQTALLGTILLFSAAANAADQQLLNMVMPDAKVLAGVNVLQAKATPFGSFVVSQITNNDKGFQEFVNLTGFNPSQDVSEILAATSGDKANPNGLILARGTFDTASIVAAILADKKHQSQTYSGATLVTSSDPKQKESVAFLDGTIAVAGDTTSVEAALDRRSSANSIDPALAAKVNTLSTTEDAWSISVASLASLFPTDNKAAQQLAVFKSIVQSSGGVKFGSNVQVNGQAVTSDPKDATALGDVIKFVAQLVAMNASKDPQAAGAAGLLQNLTVTTDGANVNVALLIPEADLEGLITSAHSPKPAGAAIRR